MSKVNQAEQIDAGSPDVIDLERFREVPTPTFPLKKPGRKTYDEWCKTLINSGLLTQRTQEHVEALALSTDLIITSLKNDHKNMRAATEMRRAAMMKLEKLDADKGIKGQGIQGDNPFAKFGFAGRARERRIG